MTSVTKDRSIEERYIERSEKSRIAFEQAKHWLPGGSSRQAGLWAPFPLTIAQGEGSYIWDIDGHRYLDLVNNYTALVHGHAYPPIIRAVKEQLPKGTCWSASCESQLTLAQLLVNRVESIDQVRFTNSGSEAGNLALMIARAHTGRNKILMARGGYHGSIMEFEAGFTGRDGPMTLVAEYGDLSTFEAILKRHGSEIAAVFLEPVMGASGVVPGSRSFLEGVKSATHQAGALFILDEVLTLRLAFGGYQSVVGIKPDLTLFGKFIGGGFPVGAVGGPEALFELFDPLNLKIFHTGTFNANPVTMVAGSASVEGLTAARIDKMEQAAQTLEAGLLTAAEEVGLPLTVNRVGSVMNLFFSANPGGAYHQRDDLPIITRFHLAALNHGLFMAPRGLIALSTVTSEDQVDEAISLGRRAMEDVIKELPDAAHPGWCR
ncbi:MAG: aspartate aminotransferase family protein [Acidiferrobacteraceae bacterium]|jgi:glutamate-1-semialdehyde 2,1-aminomutase|nr:aspartate aminotransferase family protein [Acidiferrobacteraceae bacterium]|tara:strand:+ start:46662 stop:47963 length:1302 start_codon:yes stop_codon:yes gene_type:complete